jgi:hypothetical protein
MTKEGLQSFTLNINPLPPKPTVKSKKKETTNEKGLNIISPKEFEQEAASESIIFAVVAYNKLG